MSRRENAIKLVDEITRTVSGDADHAITEAEIGAFAWWTEVAKQAGVEFPFADERSAVMAILRDRKRNHDPFASFPS